jgi:hypothetical protein
MIPWSAEEYVALKGEFMEIMDRPRDDWDRRPARFLLQDEEGAEAVYTLNPDKPEVQFARLVTARYRSAGRGVAMAHFERFDKIEQFVGTHEEELRSVKLIFDGEKGPMIDGRILDELTQSPYETFVGFEGEEQEIEVWDFNSTLVIARALATDPYPGRARIPQS